MKLVNGSQMRGMDNEVIEKYGLPGIVLMENAAAQVAAEIDRRYGPLIGKRISVVCGKGNNGGDGIAAARHLVVKYFADVIIWLAEPMDKASPDTGINLMVARNYGITVESIADIDWLIAHLKASHVIVDAILGTGVEGNPRPAAAAAIKAVNEGGRPVVSIDMPSGLGDTGAAGSPTVKASTTITLALPKMGLFLYPGIDLAGDLIVADISFPPAVTKAEHITTFAIEASDIARWLPNRSAGRDSNNGKFGSVAIIAGSPGFGGAAVLASLGAARTGAGLVTLGVPESIFMAMMTRAPEPIMTHQLPSSPDGSFDVKGIDDALSFVDKRDSVAFGPGIGTGDAVRDFAKRLIAECKKPMIIDADALTLLSKEPDHGASIVSSRSAPTVLTPHPGEMGRLLGLSTAEVQDDRLAAVREAASRFNAIVVLKGQASLVASPDGRLAVNTTGNPGMAGGGSGDVLTGVAGALLGQIDDPFQATAAAVFLHGKAGDLGTESIGMAGLSSSDIPGKVPAAIASIYV